MEMLRWTRHWDAAMGLDNRTRQWDTAIGRGNRTRQETRHRRQGVPCLYEWGNWGLPVKMI